MPNYGYYTLRPCQVPWDSQTVSYSMATTPSCPVRSLGTVRLSAITWLLHPPALLGPWGQSDCQLQHGYYNLLPSPVRGDSQAVSHSMVSGYNTLQTSQVPWDSQTVSYSMVTTPSCPLRSLGTVRLSAIAWLLYRPDQSGPLVQSDCQL